jgi:hypothetical protein
MKSNIRLQIGKGPFALTLNIPVVEMIGGVIAYFAQQAVENQQPVKGLHVIVHDGGEVDIPSSTEDEAREAMEKAVKLIDLKNPRLYWVEGETRTLV